MRDYIWAPWRGAYVASWHGGSAAAGKDECVFCTKFNENRDADNFILHRGERTVIIMNLYPYNNGHIMLIPVRHTADFELLTAEETAEMNLYKKLSVSALKKALNPDGFNIGMNLGSAAGAGIAQHLHEHIVPRWNGDTNFMPVLGETRVISEHMQTTYIKIKSCLEKEIVL
ncbi:MAG: HIT domain-containing protein [Deferribacteraceae bacterium]|jgi:ATP adenylyltransferase|nr:HIT domain-containing protein [Deferribacteraceae bacterium]